MGRVARVLRDGKAEQRWRQARVSCLLGFVVDRARVWVLCRPVSSRPGRRVGFRMIGLGGLVICLPWARHKGEGNWVEERQRA